ncbi:MAG: type III secretion system chaperone [Pseudomonadota bacterium]
MMRLIPVVCLALLAIPAIAQDSESPDVDIPQAEEPQIVGPQNEGPMTYEKLGRIIFALDPGAQPQGPGFVLTIADVTVLVVVDPNADRMRAMVPVADVADLTEKELIRMMQANFDTALDARYAIANNTLWSTYIHPLSPLEKDQFISGLGQVVNAAKTYGTLYSGGLMQFNGGDSPGLQRELIDELLKKGEEI